jgi:hypothetical protein
VGPRCGMGAEARRKIPSAEDRTPDVQFKHDTDRATPVPSGLWVEEIHNRTSVMDSRQPGRNSNWCFPNKSLKHYHFFIVFNPRACILLRCQRCNSCIDFALYYPSYPKICKSVFPQGSVLFLRNLCTCSFFSTVHRWCIML